ncbi:MAG: hypothetical protein ACYCWW_15870 [Deltaproteobacteria bacterium]
MRTFLASVLALSLGGCCYQVFNSYATTGGATGGGTTGAQSTTGGATGTAGGTSGGGTTAGGATGGTTGATTGLADAGQDAGSSCTPPASWPIHCAPPAIILTDGVDNVSALSIAPLPGGSYLVGYVNYVAVGQDGVVVVLPDGGVADGGALGYPISSLALAGGVLVSGGESAANQAGCGLTGTGCDTQIECANPAGATPATLSYVYDGDAGDLMEVDSLRLASGEGGLAAVWADTSDSIPGSGATGIALLGVAPDGGCGLGLAPLGVPTAVGASPSLSSIDVAAVGRGFDVVRAYNGSGGGSSIVLDGWPDGGSVVSRAFGAGSTWASFGDAPSIVAQDFNRGVALLALDGGALSVAATLSTFPDGGIGLAATSCGAGCNAALWFEPTGMNPGGADVFDVRYGFADVSGCKVVRSLQPSQPASALPSSGGPQIATAIGAQPGSALLVYSLNDQGASTIYASYCTP